MAFIGRSAESKLFQKEVASGLSNNLFSKLRNLNIHTGHERVNKIMKAFTVKPMMGFISYEHYMA